MANVKVANAHILEACLSNQQSVKRGREWQGQTLGAHLLGSQLKCVKKGMQGPTLGGYISSYILYE